MSMSVHSDLGPLLIYRKLLLNTRIKQWASVNFDFVCTEHFRCFFQ